MKRVLTLLLAAAILISLFPLSVFAEASEVSGQCGDNITWKYDRSTQTLYLTGSGPMYDYSEETPAPWTELSNVRRYYISDGITRIGNHAFPGGFGTNHIRIPASVTEIGSKAMAGGSVEIIFYGSAPTIAEDAFEKGYGLCSYFHGWEDADLQEYGGTMTWDQYRIQLNPRTKSVLALNSRITPEDILLDVYSPNQSFIIETFTPSQSQLQIGAHDTSSTGWKQVLLTWNSAQLTHDYIVTDGESHFDTVKVTVPAYQTYINYELRPIPTVTSGHIQLQRDIHYSVSYYDNVRMGSDAKVVITGLGDWKGLSKTVTFRILKQDISMKDIDGYTLPFTGYPQEPPYATTQPDFELGSEYVFILKNNINIGTAQFRMVGIGDYYGSTTGTLAITNGSNHITVLNGTKNGNIGEELNDEVYYSEEIVAPGPFLATINSKVRNTDYNHYAYYELYHIAGEEPVLITTHETPFGRGTETAFSYDFSHVYEGSVAEGGEFYLLAYSWVNALGEIYSGLCLLFIPAKVPPATEMVIAKLEDSGDFRREYFAAYGTDGTLGKVSWTSSNLSVAVVKDGVATLLSPGTTVITAQDGDLSASMTLTVPERLITDCDFLGFDENSGSPILCCGQILLEEGWDYIATYSHQDQWELLTISGIGLFSGSREYLLDHAEQTHTHSHDNCLDAVCDFCGTRRVAEHALPKEWLHDDSVHWQICQVCGSVENLGEHSYAYPQYLQCSACGKRSYLPGDINGDGTLNNKDVILLMQYLAGWEVYLSTTPIDLNGDNKANNKDVILLMQYLAGWEVTLQ